MIITFLILYFLLVICLVLYGGLRQNNKIKKPGSKIKLQDVSLVIPFRNEENNLERLLDSLNDSNNVPSTILFIDDHSTDNSVKVISNFKTKFSFEILSLSNDEFGKKAALRHGFDNVKTKYVLTMDADVFFGPSYFDSLENLTLSDLWILPVIQKSRSFWHSTFELDLHFMNAINVGLFGWYRPIIASGANLLFSLNTFNEIDSYDEHKHIPSGDDIFLLKDFRLAKKDIRLSNSSSNAVYTFSPISWNHFLHQRIRWIAKTTKVKDNFSTFLALSQTLFSILFYGLLIHSIYVGNLWNAFILFIGKCLIDFIGFSPYLFKFKRGIVSMLIPFYVLLFPVYNLLLLILIPFFNPIWKGRSVKV